MCEGIFGPKEVQIDHINPTVDPKIGFVDWNTYIERMFPENANEFQTLCKTCHASKSSVENNIRKQYRKTVKKLDSKKKKE